jgi:hypothetical protein
LAATIQGYVSKADLERAMTTNEPLKVMSKFPYRECITITVPVEACSQWDADGFIVDPKALKPTK